MPLTPGTRLGPYEILDPIGAGGMGEVYRAHDSRLERQVAIKVLPEHLSQSPQALARFVRETKALAALSHPNLLAIFDTGIENSISYAVTELLEGETLRASLRHGPLPWRKAVEIGTSLAEGLAAAHAKGITHRDLKLENIFLTVDGRFKILDFGLARVQATQSSGDAETQTQAGTLLALPAICRRNRFAVLPPAQPATFSRWDVCFTRQSPDCALFRAHHLRNRHHDRDRSLSRVHNSSGGIPRDGLSPNRSRHR